MFILSTSTFGDLDDCSDDAESSPLELKRLKALKETRRWMRFLVSNARKRLKYQNKAASTSTSNEEKVISIYRSYT